MRADIAQQVGDQRRHRQFIVPAHKRAALLALIDPTGTGRADAPQRFRALEDRVDVVADNVAAMMKQLDRLEQQLTGLQQAFDKFSEVWS